MSLTGYNMAKKKMKKILVTVLFLMGIGTFAFAQNNCPTGYKETPGTNNDHTGKVVTQSQCTTTTTTYNSGQNNWNGNVGGGADIKKVANVSAGGSYERKGETNSKTTQTQQCTNEKTYYYKCEPEDKNGKK